ncbi:hypothetical protein SAMN04489832_5855 [Micromonospora cremea]|uniref:Uncharacterized protein n=2 Tax=Micromonospora cremea TaxID=709881 RepID=A0A1N6ANW9_9ACTN|nr:hypothetical protein SAMN04489832_5855 [Micromonospora cremea]
MLLKPYAARSIEAQVALARIGETIRENSWIGIVGRLHPPINVGQAHAR